MKKKSEVDVTKDQRSVRQDMYSKCGTHPMIQEFNATLEKLRELEQRIAEARSSEMKINVDSYDGWTAKIVPVPNNPQGGFRVLMEPTKESVKAHKDHLALWGTVTKIPEAFTSITYFLKGNMLLHDHGGTHVFCRDPKNWFASFIELTDEEVETLKNGQVPVNLMPSYKIHE